MTMLSPNATYHAELREQLSGVGRALSYQRAVKWMARGLALGTIIVLGIIVWAWIRGTVATLPIALLIAIPVLVTLIFGAATFFVRHDDRLLARRVDHAARLNERSTTALELGARGEEFPLALAQMRDAVEHLKRVDLLDAFPMRLPRNELMTAFFVMVVAALVAISPNPWLLRARAANPAISIAREQAQRVERLAESLRAEEAAEIDPLRELLRKGARTIDARSNEPDEALNALEDLEEQIHQMSAGDDQLAAALAAVASALATDPTTSQLASAINTGDLREISRAARDLAAQTEQLSGQDRERVSRVLRDASNRAGRASPAVAGEFADAAAALRGEQGAGDEASATGMRESGDGSQGQPGGVSSGRSARDALNELGNSAAAAAERQRAESQLEASRNALERALGRTQSRSGTTGRSSTSSSQRNQAGAGAQADAGGSEQSGASGQAGEAGAQEGMEPGSGGAPGNEEGGAGEGDGGGYGTGSSAADKRGAVSNLDTITTPHQVPAGDAFSPDESSINPYLGEAGEGASQAGEESVSPSFKREPTRGNDSGSIPLGLRDLVKDYFSSLDQK